MMRPPALRVTFVLPSFGGGGGSHSVTQESRGLAELGARVRVAVPPRHLASISETYPELPGAGVALESYADWSALAALAADSDVLCATNNASLAHVAAALDELGDAPAPLAAHYLQDYEPLFHAPDSREWRRARAAFDMLPGALRFAKTDWLRGVVAINHGLVVEKVEPSIDHEVYRPRGRRGGEQLVVAAMIRPRTPRRAPARTARVLNGLARRLGEAVRIVTFGCAEGELDAACIALDPAIDHRGVLNRTEVAESLAAADLFLDASDYQAFGRTALEGMACGAVPVAPVFGGAQEFIRDGIDGYLPDTRSDEAIHAAIDAFLALAPAERQAMSLSAVRVASRLGVRAAAASELALFEKAVAVHRRHAAATAEAME